MREFWADEMKTKLGSAPSAHLMQQAQSMAEEAGHAFYSTTGEDAALVDFEGEVQELLEAVREKHSKTHIRNEVGDVIFSLINICRLEGVDFEQTLDKFAHRWLSRKALQESKIRAAGHNWRTIPRALNDQIWHDVKTELKQQEYQE